MSQAVCGAITKQGAPCRSFALPNRDTCLSHTPDLAPQVDAARRRGGTVAMRLKVLQGQRLKLDTPKALVKFVADVAQDCLAGTIEPDVARAVLYGISLQRVLIEASNTEKRLSDVERLLAQRRHA